jgi:hypothetical protein
VDTAVSTLEPIIYIEPVRKYAESPALDIPTPARSIEHYAREVELILEARDHYAPEPHLSLVDRYPRLSMVVLAGIALGVLWRAYERFK